MEKKEDLQKFILDKIADVDRMLEKENQDMAKLKLITMRSSYAKLMQNFLKNQSELSKSYFQKAKIYLKNRKIDQAISQVQMAKRKLSITAKDQSTKKISQNIDLLLVECYHQSKKSDDALSAIEELQITSEQNKESYLNLKAKIYQQFGNQVKSRQNFDMLHHLIVQKYGKNSLEEGLCLIQKGRNIGLFKHQQEGIELLNKGMQILINHRYHNPDHVAQIYETMAQFSAQIQVWQKEYSSLICAYAMIKQLNQNQEKRSIEVLNKLSSNLMKRGDRQKALQFLMQVQQIERKIHGESSVGLAKTVRKIISILTELNRVNDVKKYENQYEHLIGSTSRVMQSNNHSSLNDDNGNGSMSHYLTSPSSLQRQKLNLSGSTNLNRNTNGFSRVLN